MPLFETSILGLVLGAGLFAAAAQLWLHLKQRRDAAQEDVRFWEQIREVLDQALPPLVGTTVVLTTSYEVSSEHAGQVLGSWLRDHWPDFVALERDASATHQPWRVVMTSETITVTALLPRQWLSRMRLVSSSTGHRPATFGIHPGGGPPLPSAHLSFTS